MKKLERKYWHFELLIHHPNYFCEAFTALRNKVIKAINRSINIGSKKWKTIAAMWQHFVCWIYLTYASVQKLKIKTIFLRLLFYASRRLFNKNTESAEALPQCLLLNTGQQSCDSGLPIRFGERATNTKVSQSLRWLRFAIGARRSVTWTTFREADVLDALFQLRWQPIELDRLYTIATI